jgi:zinc/manganese transport system substrate-binding protein
MNKIVKLLLTLALFLTAFSARATVNILACEPEWGALAQVLGGDRVSIYTATNALQDPHQIQARPSLISRARSADLVVCTGSELEIGWLPILLQQSSNSKIQPGQPGYFEAAAYVQKLEVPTRLDRAEGDVHPGGNPHIQTDPRNFLPVAQALTQRLSQLDPAQAAYFASRHQAFVTRWQAAIRHWESMAAPLKGVPIVVQHKGFPYLERWLGMREVDTLEPKPGVEPNSGYLTQVLSQLQHQPAKMVIRAAYNDGRSSEWLTEHAKLPNVVLPFTVGADAQSQDLYGLFDTTVQRLLGALK